MEQIEIRKVTHNDADFLFQLMNDEVIMKRLNEIPTCKRDWEEAIGIWENDPDEENYIVWISGKQIGWFSFNNLESGDRIAWLKMAAISSGYQHKGIAKYVLKYLLQQMRERKYCSVLLCTNKDNINAQSCYQKCGFSIIEELTEIMSDNTAVRRFKMECKL